MCCRILSKSALYKLMPPHRGMFLLAVTSENKIEIFSLVVLALVKFLKTVLECDRIIYVRVLFTRTKVCFYSV